MLRCSRQARREPGLSLERCLLAVDYEYHALRRAVARLSLRCRHHRAQPRVRRLNANRERRRGGAAKHDLLQLNDAASGEPLHKHELAANDRFAVAVTENVPRFPLRVTFVSVSAGCTLTATARLVEVVHCAS